jgi:hypothetical protein
VSKIPSSGDRCESVIVPPLHQIVSGSPAAQPSIEDNMDTELRAARVGLVTRPQVVPFHRKMRPCPPTIQPSVADSIATDFR